MATHQNKGAKKKTKSKDKMTTGTVGEHGTWTLRPTDEIKSMVERGMRATGKNRQALIFDVIEKYLPDVVRKVMQEQEEARRHFGGGELPPSEHT